MKSKKLHVRRTQERYTVCSHSEPAYTAPLEPAHTVNFIGHMGAVLSLPCQAKTSAVKKEVSNMHNQKPKISVF